MAGRAGFAPATLCLTGTCSTGLSYQPTRTLTMCASLVRGLDYDRTRTRNLHNSMWYFTY